MIRPAIAVTSTLKTPDDVATMIASRPAFFTTTDGIQGFAAYSQFRGGDGYAPCMEHSVILSPKARGHGLGRALMTAIEDHARSHGAHQMIAGISGENPAAIRFHQALGYHEVARIAEAGCKFGRYIDLVLLRKVLT